GRGRDEDAGVERLQEGEVDDVGPRAVHAADGVVEHVDPVGDGLVDGGHAAGRGTGGEAHQVGDEVGARRHPLHGAGDLVTVDGEHRFVDVAGDGAGSVAAVAVDVLRGRRGRVEVPGADQLVVADVLVLGVGRVAHADVRAAAVRVGVGVPLGVGGGERRVARVHPGVEHPDHDALAAGADAGAGAAGPDRGRVDQPVAGVGLQLADHVPVDRHHARHPCQRACLRVVDPHRHTVDGVAVGELHVDVAADLLPH